MVSEETYGKKIIKQAEKNEVVEWPSKREEKCLEMIMYSGEIY